MHSKSHFAMDFWWIHFPKSPTLTCNYALTPARKAKVAPSSITWPAKAFSSGPNDHHEVPTAFNLELKGNWE